MSDNERALATAIAAWNGGDLAGYLALYDESIRLHGYSPEPMSKAEVAGFYQQIFASLSAKGRKSPALTIHEQFSIGDRVICRFTMSGEQNGPFMGVPATGKPYALNGITILRFAGGRCVERWSQADMLGLMVQIGAIPPPAAG
jgi:hypothetical protein